LLNFDGIIIGSPTYYGSMAAEIKKFLDDSVRPAISWGRGAVPKETMAVKRLWKCLNRY